ncbi:hypothetical protein Misp06_03632 [Microbulbifer sp. NBRC 101763]
MDQIVQSSLACGGLDILEYVGLVDYQAQRISFSHLEALWRSAFKSGYCASNI